MLVALYNFRVDSLGYIFIHTNTNSPSIMYIRTGLYTTGACTKQNTYFTYM